jgi:phosphoketolase
MPQSWTEVWRLGHGSSLRDRLTVHRVDEMASQLTARRAWPDTESVYRVLAAADRLTSAAVWLVLHMGFAHRVDATGAPLRAEDFRKTPAGPISASLGMVPAFVGHLTANVLSGKTRSWVMGQAHGLAAVAAVDVLSGCAAGGPNGRYDRTQAGFSNLVADFGSCAAGRDGRPPAARGGADTVAVEFGGSNPGAVEQQYVHMPLRGESVVAVVDPDACDGQQMLDGSPRWWRAEDCGLVTPLKILNANMSDRRNSVGGSDELAGLDRRLRCCGFDPITIDGGDPAAFAWAILESEDRLKRFTSNADRVYPAPMPYVIATAHGFGFADDELLPARNRPHREALHINDFRQRFNKAATRLFVPAAELAAAVGVLDTHALQGRPQESRRGLAMRRPSPPILPVPRVADQPTSPMEALDAWFVDCVAANPALRARVGSLGDLRRNQMGRTLDRLRYRANLPDAARAEAIDGGVIAACHADAAGAAALGNKGGINLIVSNEALAMTLLGALRHEIINARDQREAGTPPGWIAIPMIATSVWESGGNDSSHPDPSLTEALMAEMSDTARVLFPIDANTAVAALRAVYACRGQVGCIVTPERALPSQLDCVQAQAFFEAGAGHIAGDPSVAQMQFVTVGADQLGQALAAHRRLSASGRSSCVTAILEPGRLRQPRDAIEAGHVLQDPVFRKLFPTGLPRVILSHTRPEQMLGLLRRLDDGPQNTTALGYLNLGAGLDHFGALFANRCTWAHALAAAAVLIKAPPASLFKAGERAALAGRGDPSALDGRSTPAGNPRRRRRS